MSQHVGAAESTRPKLALFTTLFPNPANPNAGVFIRERMFRVGQRLPLIVIAPVPWFPFQGFIRRWRPHFRPPAPRREVQQGFEVYRPRFFSVPGILKCLDGIFLALGALGTLRRLKRFGRVDIIDAHFGYPDGYAATRLGRWLGMPVTITLRGTEVPHSRTRMRRWLLIRALQRAARVFAVSESLKRHAQSLGVEASKIQVVGNGVDVQKFHPVPKSEARASLGVPEKATVLITVGGLVERKGVHRVIELLPGLCERFPELHYLIVGGPTAEGDWTERLKRQVVDAGLSRRVHFLGPLPHAQLRTTLSAADVFVLATRNEGWANVLLEAMACGLPVVTTDVGGNPEVVCKPELGVVVPFGSPDALNEALQSALERHWDRSRIIRFAGNNSWENRVDRLVQEFKQIARSHIASKTEEAGVAPRDIS